MMVSNGVFPCFSGKGSCNGFVLVDATVAHLTKPMQMMITTCTNSAHLLLKSDDAHLKYTRTLKLKLTHV